ncbi:30S ribosomal protein S3 [Alphaproteobacteria bacterium]|nr:30S ribosomal protein S3 [Alphaproteobacteria bacterium]GHS95659.1 30S ribosomal protein S3 [Alphaproteobacteria bacterium]
MGQKVNPIGMRVGVNRTWDSCWISKKNYAELLHQDFKIRAYIMKELAQAGVSKVVIERPDKKAIISVHSARPGVLIGKKGADIEKLKKSLAKMTDSEVSINIVEVRKPEVDAKLVAEGIAQQIERRVSFRRAMKRSMQTAMRLGVFGIRVNCSGRLGGTEIARMEWYREGRVPLHTLKSDVDFGLGVAKTTYGTCGIKVWIYKGDQKGYAVEDAKKKRPGGNF